MLVAALVAAGAAVGAVLLLDDPQEARLSPDRGSTSPVDREGAATAFVPDLAAVLDDAAENGLGDGGRGRLAEVAADEAAHAELLALAGNLDRLRVADFRLRFVDESDLELTGSQQERYGDRAWVADVQLTWRFPGVDRRRSTLEVPVVLAWDGDDPAFVTSRVTAGRRVPLWWQAAVVVRRTPDTLVVAARRERLARLSRQAVTAVDIVRATLPGWRGTLVVEAARTAGQFRSAAGLPPAAAREIAAVTTTTDGSSRGAPRVYVNPSVYDDLGPNGQQIVLSHEAAHVALGAATSSAPMWLSEGLADYVALVDTAVPVRTLAAQVLRLVREEGAPQRLPGRAELDGGDAHLGAWYEASWLAARLIAERYGEEALFELHRVADADGSTKRAFREVLGTTEAAFVEEWRTELLRLAG